LKGKRDWEKGVHALASLTVHCVDTIGGVLPRGGLVGYPTEKGSAENQGKVPPTPIIKNDQRVPILGGFGPNQGGGG